MPIDTEAYSYEPHSEQAFLWLRAARKRFIGKDLRGGVVDFSYGQAVEIEGLNLEVINRSLPGDFIEEDELKTLAHLICRLNTKKLPLKAIGKNSTPNINDLVLELIRQSKEVHKLERQFLGNSPSTFDSRRGRFGGGYLRRFEPQDFHKWIESYDPITKIPKRRWVIIFATSKERPNASKVIDEQLQQRRVLSNRHSPTKSRSKRALDIEKFKKSFKNLLDDKDALRRVHRTQLLQSEMKLIVEHAESVFPFEQTGPYSMSDSKSYLSAMVSLREQYVGSMVLMAKHLEIEFSQQLTALDLKFRDFLFDYALVKINRNRVQKLAAKTMDSAISKAAKRLGITKDISR